MITVHFETTREGIFRMSAAGHAGAGAWGSDPVCAAVTALCYTLAQTLKLQRLQLGEEPRILIREGEAEIAARPIPEGVPEVAHTFYVVQTGMRLLAHNYPSYVKIL